MKMYLSAPADFNFTAAVCSHGFFVLAPNRWMPAERELRTVVAVGDERAMTVRVRATAGGRLLLGTTQAPSPPQKRLIKAAVRRMLRMDEDLAPFHELCRASVSHRSAAEMKFGRLLAGASLFEDMVKVICTCNVTWRQTVAMVDRLTDRWGVPASGGGRAFPTPAGLARATVKQLKEIGRLGYRADYVRALARQVVDGRLNLESIERFDGPTEELYKQLTAINGIGPYAAGHLCMLLGRYDRPAVDTEMIRFLKTRYPRRRWTPASIRRYYRRWHPYEFLAYWWELWSDYVERHGPSETWSPELTGAEITRPQR